MGWAHCGTDSEGREIGYAIEAICDEPGCGARIDRGLSYACGGMHGEDPGCEKYFCSDHLGCPGDATVDEYEEMVRRISAHGLSQLCKRCGDEILRQWREDQAREERR